MFNTGCCNFVEYAAYFTLIVTVLKGISALWCFIHTYFLGSYPNFTKTGEWSVVTGATDGIGLAYAKELAKCGQNIVLISRNEEKLVSTAEQIEKKYDVETMTIAVDFAKPNIYEGIAKELEGLNIGVLINNVGISFSFPEYFLNVEKLSNVVDDMIYINMMSAVKMIEIVLPRLVAKKKGIILNVSSGSAAQPTPLLSLYSASKQFVDCFSKTLNAEYKKQGVIIQSLMPYYVTTKLSKIRRSSFMVPTPEQYVRSSLKTIGKSNRTFGYFAHALQSMIIGLLPESIYLWAALKMNNQIRKKALKKMSQKKE